jgi:hypothetical protein
MFEPGSRYENIEESELTAPDGRVIRYVKRRMLPRGEEMALLGEVTVGRADRLDTIAARTLGLSDQFWWIADANNALHPLDLVELGRRLRIPVPMP